MSKKCGKCQQVKDLTSFDRNAARGDGYDSRCKICKKENRGPKSDSVRLAERRWNYANSEKIRDYTKKHEVKIKYGITLEEYKACMDTSDKCEICGSTNILCYDHCHDSMKFRGVLCRKCNTGIGHLGDTADHVYKAFQYLTKK